MKRKTLLILVLLAPMLIGLGCSGSKKATAATTAAPGQANVAHNVVITTVWGDMKVRLYDDTPQHRDNFLKLAREGYYDGTLFHRVIPQFMIQGGDPDSKNAKPGQALGSGTPGHSIPAEFRKNRFHKRGVLAAARLPDEVNPKKESMGSQFYIVQGRKFTDADLDRLESRLGKLSPSQREAYKMIGGAPHLDGSYTVFGEVVSGIEIVDKISKGATDPRDRPLTDVSMIVKVVD